MAGLPIPAEKAIPENTVEPILDSLRNIKSAYEASGMNSPQGFIIAKALEKVSEGVVRHWIYKDDKDSFALRFDGREDKDQILDIARKTLEQTTTVVENKTFYIDSKNYVIGILVE